jgi:RNA polymerase sigma factor (sigma-70 family)
MADDYVPSTLTNCSTQSRFDDRPPDERLLLRWDTDIRRAASAAARRTNLGTEPVADLAQDARLRVFRIFRQGGPSGEGYTRTVIANSVRKSARREARALDQLPSTDDGRVHHQADNTMAPSLKPDVAAIEVRTWVRSLSTKLQAIYELIYLHEYTQREVAMAIGVTQPRVTQLHRELLRQGRVELAHLAA